MRVLINLLTDTASAKRLKKDVLIFLLTSWGKIHHEGGAYLPTEIYNNEKWQKYLQAKVDNNKSNGYRWFKKWELSFGIEVEEDYPLNILHDFEIITIPQSMYIIFNCRMNPGNKHDDVIKSAWSAQKDYDVASNGLKWAIEKIPYFETEDKKTGYTLDMFFKAMTEQLTKEQRFPLYD